MESKIFHHAKKISQKPVVLVAGDTDFVGFYFSELLRLKNCQVISWVDLSKEKIKEVDYVFCLTEEKIEKAKAALEIAEKFGAKFLLAVYKDSAVEKALKGFLRTKEIDWRIVRLAFIYGPRMNLGAGSELASLIKEAVSGGPLPVPGDGSRKIYPTFVSDIVYGLSKAMFSSGTGGKIFSLVNPEVVTLLDFAQELKEQSPKPLKIEFIAEEKTSEVNLLAQRTSEVGQADLGWKAKVGIKEGVKQTLEYLGKKKKLKRASPPQSITRLTTHLPLLTTKLRVITAAILLFLSLLLYPFASLGFNGFWGVRNLQGAQQALQMADFRRAAAKAQTGQQAFRRANQRIQQFDFLFRLTGQERLGARLEKLFAAGDKVGESVVHAGLAAQSGVQLGKIIFQDQEGDIDSLLSDIKVELDFAYDQLSLAEADLRGEKDLVPIEIPLTEIRQLILKTRDGMEIVPEVIGIEGKRAYLILLQNNMELRPTGGFIGSYALVTFDEGKLIDFEVEDVYTADGQLKGHVEPPAELKKYLGEAGWYLRDSNWSPDFPTSALRAEWFLEKETGRKVNGVIGIDLFLAQNILKQIGEVEVPDFQEKINHQNLFERAEYHSEIGFFPGSTQKKDFLASLTRALFEKIRSSEEETWLALGKAIYQSLREKDILVYLHETEAMEVISNLGWDGGIRSVECEVGSLKCLVDYLMIVEANVGVNKANHFVVRSLTHQATIDQRGAIKEKLQIQYQNQSESETFPAGRYKNYLRILVPRGTELEEILIDNKELEEEKIDKDEVVDKDSFGFLVEVPIKGQKSVEISYRLAEKVDFTKGAQYLLLLQKQPGIRDEAFNLWVTAPEEVTLLEAKPSAAQSGNTLLFNPEFNQDIVFEARLIK